MTADLGWGWYNKFYFRGVNILKQDSPNHVSAGAFQSNLRLIFNRENIDNLTVNFSYLQGLGQQIPRNQAAQLPPNRSPNADGQATDNEKYDLESRKRYAEYDIYVGYSRLLTQNIQGTVGFNHYQFSDAGFYSENNGAKEVEFADESIVRLDWIGLPHVQPYIMWAHDFDGFEGDFLELRIDGSFDIGKRVQVRPYASVSYDMQYNGSDNGWNSLEVGTDLAIQLNKYFTLTLRGGYVHALEDTVDTQGNSTNRVNPGFWFGATISAFWGPHYFDQAPLETKDSKTIIEGDIQPAGPWEFSVGAGWRQVGYEFGQKAFQPYDVFALARELGRLKLNGVAGTGFPELLVNQTLNNYYQSFVRNYEYSPERHLERESFEDDESTAFPYVKLDREVWRSGRVSARAGLGYSYTLSGGDSGQRLARLDSLNEIRSEQGKVASIVAGGFQDNSTLPLFAPKPSNNEVVKVASFAQSKADVSLHDISVPLGLRFDLTRRLHAELSVAPTLTLLDARLSTSVARRELDNLSRDVFNPLGGKARDVSSATVTGTGGGQIGAGGTIFNTANIQNNNQQQNQASAGATGSGKGGKVPSTPELPGKDRGGFGKSETSLDVLFGVSGAASLLLDLDDAGRWYLEVWAKYHWSEQATISNSLSNVTLDLSSVQAGAGMGYRF